MQVGVGVIVFVVAVQQYVVVHSDVDWRPSHEGWSPFLDVGVTVLVGLLSSLMFEEKTGRRYVVGQEKGKT